MTSQMVVSLMVFFIPWDRIRKNTPTKEMQDGRKEMGNYMVRTTTNCVIPLQLVGDRAQCL